jgi:hypothetical protein
MKQEGFFVRLAEAADGGNEEKRPLPALIPMEDQGLGGRFHHQLKLIRISL